MENIKISDITNRLAQLKTTLCKYEFIMDLTDEPTYEYNSKLIRTIGNTLLEREGKKFIVDENNKTLLRFLLFYFNGDKRCEEIELCGRKMSTEKNLILEGAPGTGKSLLMKIFQTYCVITQNPLMFTNIGATELLNYYKQFGHLNLYTYNSCGVDSLDSKPQIFCLNDIGIDVMNQKNYGTDMNKLIDEWLYSRYELWLNRGYRYFITTNMNEEERKKQFDQRLDDRFKSFNIVPVLGGSRR
jgi:hypothetical protein